MAFEASNGWYIDDKGCVFRSNGSPLGYPIDLIALRRLYQEERDAELGRWRDPVEPDYVVYVQGDDIACVASEKTGSSLRFVRNATLAVTVFSKVAERYFQTHPQNKPLPTEPGLYRHSYVPVENTADEIPTDVLILYSDGVWGRIYKNCSQILTAEELAQEWHDAGELVRLVEEELS